MFCSEFFVCFILGETAAGCLYENDRAHVETVVYRIF